MLGNYDSWKLLSPYEGEREPRDPNEDENEESEDMGKPNQIGEVWVGRGSLARVPMFSQYGVWGVTEALPPEEGFSVTHLPTGFAATRSSKSLQEAKRIARALQKALPDDFSLQNHEALGEAARAAIDEARK